MTLELIAGDLDDAIVYRERENIDILVHLPTLNLVVAIENKVGAKAGDGQLARYSDALDREFGGVRKLLVFLTPDGAAPDHADYIAYDYVDLAETLENLTEETHEPIPSETGLIIRHYVEMLRRHVVQDEKLRAIAVTLYERHRDAFDFIFECRPEPASLLNVVCDRALGISGLTEDSRGSAYFRFAPEIWDERLTIIRGDPAKWSKTGRGLLFETKVYAGTPGRVNVALVLGPADPTIRAQVYDAALAQPKVFTGITKPPGNQWTTLFSRDLLTAAQAKSLSFEAQAANASLGWSDFQAQNLQILTEAILEIDNRLAAAV